MHQRSVYTLLRLISRYFAHDVSAQGAALAYYLLFSLFPLLILVSGLIGQLRPGPELVPDVLLTVLPEDVLLLIQTYLEHVSQHVSRSMLWFSAVFSVWFPLRATRHLLRAVRRAYGLDSPKQRIRYAFRVVFFTVLLLFCLVISLLLLSLGSRLIPALSVFFSLPQHFPLIWSLIRFGVLGTVMFAVVFGLYAAAQDTRVPPRFLLPGAALSACAWIILSLGYSFYAEHISNYSAVYGTLGAVVALLIWLYLTGITVIMGAECNHILLHRDDDPPQHQRRFDQGEML